MQKISVFLWFDRRITLEKFWAMLWQPDRLNCDFYDLANIRREPSSSPSLIASNVIFADRVAHLPDEEIVRRTLEEISEFAPEVRAARVLHSLVHHIPMAIPCPLVGTEVHRPAASTPLSGVYLAGDWTRTALPCSMESAVKSGFLAAELVLDHAGQSRRVVRNPPPAGALVRWIGALQRAKEKGGLLA